MSSVKPAEYKSQRDEDSLRKSHRIPCDDSRDEELRAIGVLASIGHAKQSLLGVLQLEVLVRKFISVDRLPSSAISSGEVSALDHE